MSERAPSRRDALTGLAPAASARCPRCGSATTALANGRGRLDLCEGCGTVEFVTPEGLQIFRLQGDGWPAAPRRR